MKNLLIVSALCVLALPAFAQRDRIASGTMAVNFQSCSHDNNIQCAKVYNVVSDVDGPVEANVETPYNRQIWDQINKMIDATPSGHGPTVAQNIEGVLQISDQGNYFLQVESLQGDPNADRPRGFGK